MQINKLYNIRFMGIKKHNNLNSRKHQYKYIGRLYVVGRKKAKLI